MTNKEQYKYRLDVKLKRDDEVRITVQSDTIEDLVQDVLKIVYKFDTECYIPTAEEQKFHK